MPASITTVHPADIPEVQQSRSNSDTKAAFVDEYLDSLSLKTHLLRQTESGRVADRQLEKAAAGTPDREFKFAGQLFLIGGVADSAWNDMISRLPKDAKVVAVGLAAEDGDGASLDLAKEFEISGIKPENITIITSGKIPEDSKYHWSKDLPDKFDLIYFGGGDQTLLKERFTQVDKLKEALINGAMVAGNSAGAAIMPSEMITGGNASHLTHGEGFSLLPFAITDTHVHERHREDRDVSALYDIGRGKLPVVGIDVDTRVLFHWEGEHLVGEVGDWGSVRVFKAPGEDLQVESSRDVKPELTYGRDGAGKGKAALVWELKAGDKFILR
jgi:cyanophycinase